MNLAELLDALSREARLAEEEGERFLPDPRSVLALVKAVRTLTDNLNCKTRGAYEGCVFCDAFREADKIIEDATK